VNLVGAGKVPMDRWLARWCCALVAVLLFAMAAERLVRRQNV
jgi:hypothetical protein